MKSVLKNADFKQNSARFNSKIDDIIEKRNGK